LSGISVAARTSAPEVTEGYARITRTGGNNSFIAYAVIKDGGGIASDASGNYAFGVYTDSRSHVDSPDFVEFGNYLCSGEDSSEKNDSFMFLSLTRGVSLPAGESTYNSFIVTGTMNDVKEKMHQLYLIGAN
jgi:hypothetical protein